MTSARTSRRRCRNGVSTLEIVIASGLFSVAIITILPVVSRARTVRAELADRAAARQLVANFLEQTLAHSPDSTAGGPPATSDIEAATVPVDQLNFLDDPQFDIRVETTSDDPPLRRVTATLTWTARTGEPARPVSLSAWIPPAEPQP